jgi:hypothetical protein
MLLRRTIIRAALVAILGLLALSEPSRGNEPTEALVAHWKFDEGEGETAYDSVAYGHGTIHGANWAIGKNACALDFDGVDDYVTTQVRDIDKLSVAAWVNVSGETLGDQQNIINNCENGGYGLSYDFNLNKKLVFSAHINGEYRTAFSDIIIQKHKWYHVVGTYDGNDGHLYIDGVKQADSFRDAGVITDTRLPLLVGANPETDGTIEYGRCFNGKVDDVRIYDRALSHRKIEQLHRNGLSGHSLPIGPMTAINHIERAIREQVEEWKRIDDALGKELTAYRALEQMLQNGNYGDLSYDAILTARQQISTAIQHSQKSKESLEKSIEDLEAALEALGFELVPRASTWLEQLKQGPTVDIPPDKGPGVKPGKVYVVEPLVGIDKVRFGMTVEEMKQILGEPKQSRGPLHEYRDAGFAIFAIGDAVRVIACGNRVRADSPLVENCKCRTDKGIGMDSSREDIIEAYGEPSSTETFSNGAIMLSYEPLKSEFLLMQDNVIYMSFAVEGFVGGVGRPRTTRPLPKR